MLGQQKQRQSKGSQDFDAAVWEMGGPPRARRAWAGAHLDARQEAHGVGVV